MDPNHLTQKSQEALHDAQTKALRFGHTEVDAEHLLLALLDQSGGIVPPLLSQAGAEPDKLRAALESELSRRPRVTGPGANPGQFSITLRLARLLDSAVQEAGRLKDEYVSVEHLVLAMLAEGQATVGLALLQAARAGADPGILSWRLPDQDPRQPAGHPGHAGGRLRSPGEGTAPTSWPTRPAASTSTRLIGRDAEIRRVIQILPRKTKNNSEPDR